MRLKNLLLLLGCGFASAVMAQPFKAEPGALHPLRGAASIRYFVPVGQPPLGANIRTVFGRNFVDFDTGKPIGITEQGVKNAPRILGRPVGIVGPVSDSRGHNYYSYWCGSECVWNLKTHRQVGSDYLSLETVEVLPINLRRAMAGSIFTDSGMPLRYITGYQVTLMGKPQWTKVYLVQTLGTYVIWGKTKEDMGENIVMFSSHVLEAMLPGDDYFYLTIGDSALDDWGVILRINLLTGSPVTKHRRVKAVDLSELQIIFDEVIARLRKHYPSTDEDLKCPFPCRFVAQPEDASDPYKWKHYLNDDAAELTNHLISQRWFKEFIK